MSDMKQNADAFIRLVEIMDRLRVECPWDKKTDNQFFKIFNN